MCLWADKWIKDGCTSCLWLLTTSSAIQPPVNLHPSDTAALNYTQKVIRLTSFTELSTRWVTCRAGSPFAPASPCVTRISFFFIHPLHLPSFFSPTNFMSHDRQVGVNATHRKPLPRPRLSWAAERPSLPVSPCHTKEERWRTSANSCQSCHALCSRLALDKQLVEIPAETCRPAPPHPLSPSLPSLPPYFICWFISFQPLFPPFLFSFKLKHRSFIPHKCLKTQLKALTQIARADRDITPVIPCVVHTRPPQDDPTVITPPHPHPHPYISTPASACRW